MGAETLLMSTGRSLKRISRQPMGFQLPLRVTKVYEVEDGTSIPGAFRQAMTETTEDSLVAVVVYGVVVVLDPLSDPDLLLRDVLRLQGCFGAVIGPRSTKELDLQLDNLCSELRKTQLLLDELRQQLVSRAAELNDELGNSLRRLPY